MRRMIVLLLAVVSLAGCAVELHAYTRLTDIYGGGHFSWSGIDDTKGVVFGAQPRYMFTDRVGIGGNLELMIDIGFNPKRADHPYEVAGSDRAAGAGVFIGPTFRVFDIGERVSFFTTPGFAMSMLMHNADRELVPGFATIGFGGGVDLSADFYMGEFLFIRLGLGMTVEWTTGKYGSSDDRKYVSRFIDPGESTRFNLYPRIGFGWRTGGHKEEEDADPDYKLPNGTDTLSGGFWSVGNYVDEFGDNTGERYITLPVKYFAKGSQQQPLSLDEITITKDLFGDTVFPVIRIRSEDRKILIADYIELSYRVIGGAMDGMKMQDFFVSDRDIYTYDGRYTISIDSYRYDEERFIGNMIDALATGSDVELVIWTDQGYTSNYILPGKGFGRAASKLFDVSSP